MKSFTKVISFLLPLLTVLAIFLIWEVASAVIGSEYILPSLGQTLTSLLNLFKQAEFYKSLGFTLLRSLISFILSFVLGFIFAFLSSKSKVVRGIVNPLMSIVRALPTIAIILLLLFWTNSKIAPIIVTMLVVLPTSYTHLYSAFDSVDKTAVEAGRVDGANEKQVFSFLVFPQIAPAFYSAIGSGISLNFKLMVAAEVLAQTANSIGYMLNTSKVYFEISQMMALVLVSVAVGVIVELIFTKISLKTGEWK